MPTSRTDDRVQSGRACGADAPDGLPVDPVEHYVTGFVGFALTLVGTAMVYPALAAASEVLHYLSSTLLVFTFLAAWLLVWLTLEVLWEWRAGRLVLT
jgi:hypothetical protein